MKLGDISVNPKKIKIIRVGQVSNQGSQSGMVFDTDGLFPTVCACTHGYAIGNIIEYFYKEDSEVMNNIKVIGNYMPSNHDASRVVCDEGIAPTVKENHGTVTAVRQQVKHEEEMNMWKNELTRFDFLMEEVKVFDVFAGIGALHQALKELGVPTKVTSLSEIDIDATISYAAGHIPNFKDLEFEYPSDEEMKKWLMDRNIGYSYEKDKSSVPRMKKDKLRLAYKANVLLKNLGDISKINYEEIPDFDLMNFSFSCTDISNSGKQRGMRNPDGTPTRSGLYIYGIKAIRVKKPKYVMIENVKGLIQKKFIDDFYSIINELEEIGYNCYYPTKEDKKGNKTPMCLNAKYFGVPQNRERIFVICIRKDVDNGNFKFPQGKDHGVRLKDVIEEQVDEKYYLSQKIQDRIELNGKSDEGKNELNIVGTSAPENRTIGQRNIMYGVNGVMSTLTATDYKQPKQIIDNGAIRGNVGTISTSHNGMNVVEETTRKFRIRRLTPLECWRLMGFPDENFYKAKELGLSDSALYKQAGNSIVVNCLYYIFKNLFTKL